MPDGLASPNPHKAAQKPAIDKSWESRIAATLDGKYRYFPLQRDSYAQTIQQNPLEIRKWSQTVSSPKMIVSSRTRAEIRSNVLLFTLNSALKQTSKPNAFKITLIPWGDVTRYGHGQPTHK